MINPDSRELNSVTVLGVPSPGIARISGAAIPYNWDIQQGYGMSGAVSIFKGRGLVRFTLTIVIWTKAHFLQWEVFSKLLEPPKPFKPLVVEMRHPLLSALGVKAVSAESIGQFEKQTNGTWVSTSQFIEYRPPVPALVKPRGSIPSPTKAVPVAAATEADLALTAALARFETARTAAQ